MTDAELISLAKARGGSVGPSAAETLAKRKSISEALQEVWDAGANDLAKYESPDALLNEITGRKQNHTPGRMNKLEAAYAARLDLLKINGEILGWQFEAVKLRLADKTWYTPDFMVVLVDGGFIEFHEIKGFMRDDAAVKFKVARETFPMFRFVLVRRERKGWVLTPRS